MLQQTTTYSPSLLSYHHTFGTPPTSSINFGDYHHYHLEASWSPLTSPPYTPTSHMTRALWRVRRHSTQGQHQTHQQKTYMYATLSDSSSPETPSPSMVNTTCSSMAQPWELAWHHRMPTCSWGRWSRASYSPWTSNP